MPEEHRIALSLRLGIGLGIAYSLIFFACLANIPDIKKSAGLAFVLIATFMIMGLWRQWWPAVKEALEQSEEDEEE